ncbi:MAG: GMC family oxidoreductase [Pseudomonadota bacterium]
MSVTFPTRKPVDFVIVGSGAAGGVLAGELSTAGFGVVVLEQGPYRRPESFIHDEWNVMFGGDLTGHPAGPDPQTFRHSAGEEATVPGGGPPPALYARMVGGSSVHYSGNFWRMRPLDFKERSLLGEISGTGFTDWPISYEELEPYYTRVDWEIGVSGAPGPFDPPRSRPYPVPPLPIKSSGALFEKGAQRLGLHPQVAPKAILSQPHNGRPGCIHCGFCIGFGCEVSAKSSALATSIPKAEASGRCEIRPLSTVHRIALDAQGRAREVVYFDGDGNEQAQRSRAVILAANGAETPRILFLSEGNGHADGLANSSGLVGKYLMFNGHQSAHATFDEPLNEYKSVQCTRIVMDFYETDPARGYYGGGGIDARPLVNSFPVLYATGGLPPDVPRWGKAYRDYIAHNFTRNMTILANTTSLPLESNNITLDPKLKDMYGRPAVRMTYRDHDDDLAIGEFLQRKGVEIMEAAGANRVWADPIQAQTLAAHLLGTCRMGNDPARSVVDRYHRTHDVANLFICDGSSMVSSGRGQPTMTIQALAFRAAEHIANFARAGEIPTAS